MRRVLFAASNQKSNSPKKLPKALSRIELAALFKQAEQDAQNGASQTKKTMWLALELMFSTGIRVGELCGIKLQDIGDGGKSIRIRGKGSRERLVYIVNDKTLELLQNIMIVSRECATANEALLLTRRMSPASPDFIRRNLHAIAKRAKIRRRVTPHMLRHSAATQLLEQGVDIRFVQRLLGHSSISTTEIYTHVSDESLKSCLARANPRAKLNP